MHSIFPPWSAKDELSLLSSVLEIANEPAESYNPRVNLFERIGKNLENYIENRAVLDKVRELRRKFEENCCEIREVDDVDVVMSSAAFEISGKIWGDGDAIMKEKVMMKDEETGTLRVRKSRSRRSRDSVEEILAKWEEHNNITDTENSIQRTPAKGSRKGCMEGKGGPENSNCKYRGVRQRISGKWASEIREPNRGRQLWLGTFDTAIEGALAYDAAARKMYGSAARVNFAESCSPGNGASSTSASYEPTTSSHHCNSIHESKELKNPKDEAVDEVTTACPPPSYTEEAGTVVLKDEPNTEGSLDQYVQFQDLPDYMFDVDDFMSVIDTYPACGTSSEQDMVSIDHDQSGGVDAWQQYGGVDEQYGSVDENTDLNYDNTLFPSQNDPEENMTGNLEENMTGKLWHHTGQAPAGGDHIRDATKGGL